MKAAAASTALAVVRRVVLPAAALSRTSAAACVKELAAPTGVIAPAPILSESTPMTPVVIVYMMALLLQKQERPMLWYWRSKSQMGEKIQQRQL
jgi:hypothetical protein